MATSIEYYKQIRKAQKEYEKARNFVEDIVLSFNRELKREADRLELISFKVEGNSAKADTNQKKIDNVEKRITPFEEQLGALKQTISETHLTKQHHHLIRTVWFRIENQRHRSRPGHVKGKDCWV